MKVQCATCKRVYEGHTSCPACDRTAQVIPPERSAASNEAAWARFSGQQAQYNAQQHIAQQAFEHQQRAALVNAYRPALLGAPPPRSILDDPAWNEPAGQLLMAAINRAAELDDAFEEGLQGVR